MAVGNPTDAAAAQRGGRAVAVEHSPGEGRFSTEITGERGGTTGTGEKTGERADELFRSVPEQRRWASAEWPAGTGRSESQFGFIHTPEGTGLDPKKVGGLGT